MQVAYLRLLFAMARTPAERQPVRVLTARNARRLARR